MDDIAQRLPEAEGSGRVEYKRSVLWPREKDPIKVQGVLMRLANANPEVGGLLHLGREDDGSIVGLVDRTLAPVTNRQLLQASEQKLMQIAQRLDPPLQIRWFEYELQGMTTIVVEVPGRPKGAWYQDETGVTKTGSASHPVIAKQALLQTWAREGFVTGTPPYHLDVKAYTRGLAVAPPGGGSEAFEVLTVDILNLGGATSYPDSIGFQFDIDGRSEAISMMNGLYDAILNRLNPTLGTALEPGSRQSFHYRLTGMASGVKQYVARWLRVPSVNWANVSLTEVVVRDQIGNAYRTSVSDVTQTTIHSVLISEETTEEQAV